jgi:GntR family transcriptional regulator
LSKLSNAYDRSRVSLYIQVASVLRERILSGQWAVGEKISTLEELEREFQVARVTVRQAVEVLREEGLLQARQGRGTFVSATTQDRHWVKLATNWTSLIESLKDNVPRKLTVENKAPPPQLDEADGQLASSYVRLQSVQYRNQDPYSSVNVSLARHVYDLAPARFKAAAALVAIDELSDLNLRDAHQTLTIGSADPALADLLNVPIGSPTVNAHCVVVDDGGIAIYVGDIIYRSDSIKLQVNLLDASSIAKSADAKLAATKSRPPMSAKQKSR